MNIIYNDHEIEEILEDLNQFNPFIYSIQSYQNSSKEVRLWKDEGSLFYFQNPYTVGC